MFRKYAYGWITLTFFLGSLLLHWYFGWRAFVDEAQAHSQAVEVGSYLDEMLRDTFENWQSEFLQLLWQVGGLAYFLYIGSPSSKENDDRMEVKIDALLRAVGGEKAEGDSSQGSTMSSSAIRGTHLMPTAPISPKMRARN